MTARRLIADPVSRHLLDAADYIEAHGWCQDRLRAGDGSVCLVGALTEFGEHAVQIEAANRVADYLDYKGPPISWWNDARGRTKQEVLDALRGAALAPHPAGDR